MYAETTLQPDFASIEGFQTARLGLERSIGQFLSRLLDTIAEGLSDREYEFAAQLVNAMAEFESKVVRLQAHELLKQESALENNPPPRSTPNEVLRQQIRAKLTLKKTTKSLTDQAEKAAAEPVESSHSSFLLHMQSLVERRRLFRRYLSSRFGMKRRLLRRCEFQQTRLAQEDGTFAMWLGRRVKAAHKFSEGEVDELFSRWSKEQLRESALLDYVKRRWLEAETEFSIWLAAMLVSGRHLHAANDGAGFDLTTLTCEVLKRMEIVLEEFPLILRTAELEAARQLNLSDENFTGVFALAELSAWVISHTSLTVNHGVAKALSTDGKPILESFLDRVPANLLIALDEKKPTERFSPGHGDRSVLSRVNQMLRDDLPLDAKHEELSQSRSRKSRTKGESPDSEYWSSFRDAPQNPIDMDTLEAQDFTLREEARLVIPSLVNRAGLSPREGQVLELHLKDYSELEISAALIIKEGTASALKATAKKKLRKAAGLE